MKLISRLSRKAGVMRMAARRAGTPSAGLTLVGLTLVGLTLVGCTQEWQNKISRSIQNWTGTDGVLDVLSEGKVMYRFIKIDKLSTAAATGDSAITRPYRFGYGVFDKNMNYIADPDEKRVYFEISDYATSYIFYENPY